MSTGSNSGGIVTLGKDFEILSGSPLPEFNAPGGPAFAARARNSASPSFVAIICNSLLPVRSGFVNVARTIDAAGIPKYRESGIVHWPATDSHHFAFVYDPPVAQRYWRSLDENHQPFGEDALNRRFIMPFLSAFSELQRTGITHGSIRINNIFWSDSASTTPQLGECLSAPPGIGQPILFETLERALSNVSGRGVGVHTDDTYALGITLAFMVLGQNPMKGMDDKAIIQAKLERGSFSALIGNHRLPGSHVELLRGLLADDSAQRWTAADLQEWFGGRRLTPKNSSGGRRANRHISFLGKEYWQARPLATALSSNVREAVKVIENRDVENWVQRSLNDHNRTVTLVEAINELKEMGKVANYEEQLVTRTCIALDPASPIRYRGISVMPDGIGVMLAEAIQSGNANAIQILSEIISLQFVTLWVNAQREAKIDYVPLAQQLERMRAVLEKQSLGNGVERVAYELNPTLPCVSPMLKNQYVASIRLLLPALERVANAPNHPEEPIDRHIAAFLAFNDKKGEALFEQIAKSHIENKRGLALLTMFADIQYRYGPDQLPGLAKWLEPLLDPSIKRLFNKLLREKVRKQLKSAVSEGNLNKIVQTVDDPKLLNRDEADFLNARLLYQNVIRESSELSARLSNREELMANVGRPLAASISSFFAIILIAVAVGRAFISLL